MDTINQTPANVPPNRHPHLRQHFAEAKCRIVVPDNPPQPVLCVRCHREIAVLITATTPRNPRPHIVQVPTAYIRTVDGPMCPDCYPAYQAEQALIVDIDTTYAPILRPIVLGADELAAAGLPTRIYTSNGRTLGSGRGIHTEPLSEQQAPADGDA